jgi:hypothetical protein
MWAACSMAAALTPHPDCGVAMGGELSNRLRREPKQLPDAGFLEFRRKVDGSLSD